MNSTHNLGSPAVGISTDHGISQDSSSAPAFSVHIARSIEEVEAIREIWAAWKGHRDSDIDFCLEFVWSGEAFIRPHVIVIYRYGRPDAMLVGRLDRVRMNSQLGYLRLPGMWARLLTFADGGLLGNPSAENSDEFIKSIMNSLRQGEADVAMLHQPSTDSPIYQKALSVPGFASRDHLTNPTPHYLMRLPDNIDEVYRGLSSGLRKELRRNQRKILEDFGDSMKIQCCRDTAELDGVLSQVEEIAKKTYQRGLGVGFQDTEEMRRGLKLCAQKGWLRIYLLSFGDRPCAFWIGTVYGGTFLSDYIGYDTEVGKYSPGRFLLINMIEEFCREGVKAIDFGFGGGEYKERFGNRQWLESSVYIFAPRVKGLALNAARTTAGLIDDTVKMALERTNLLPKIKRLWRGQLAKRTGTRGKNAFASNFSAPRLQMNSPPPDISIIIPAFNEERRLPKSIELISAYLATHLLRSEVIVVDDGSSDGTARLVESCRKKYPELRLVSNGRNRGKGFSVRHGMLEARGEIALFTDADLSTPIEEADKLFSALREQGYDAAIGSRRLDRNLIEVHQSALRETAGVLFNMLVRWIPRIDFSDTQCGFKAFRRERATILFEQQRIERFGFDPEILFLAKRHGLRVAEIPVRWSHDSATKVHVVADGIRMFLELLVIRWNALRGDYPPRRKS